MFEICPVGYEAYFNLTEGGGKENGEMLLSGLGSSKMLLLQYDVILKGLRL